MADKQPLNATFFAFRKREPGGALLSTSIAFAVLAIAGLGLFAWLNWRAVADYIAWITSLGQQGQVDPNDPAAFQQMMPPQSVMSLGPSYFLFLIVYYMLLAAYEAACLKWMIRGERGGLFGLALNADTLRVYFTYWLWYLLLLAVYVVIAIVLVGVMAGVAIGAGGNPEAMGPAVAVGLVLLVCATLVLIVYFSVRFAPAAATSIGRRRFSFFDAWTVTKGRFWALFGSFALLGLMYMVGAIIASVGAMVVMGTSMMAQVSAEPTTPEEAFAVFASPGVWIPLAAMYGLIMLGSFFFYLALFGVNARAVQAALEEGKIQVAS